MQYEFDAEIRRLEGKIQWSVFYFPHSADACFGSKGNIPVKITVDCYPFDHMLLPSRNGHYLVYNEFIRRAVGKEIGDSVHVILKKDEEKRTCIVPVYLETILKDNGTLEAFLKQPDYLKREQINQIELAKKEETKRNRIHKLINLLTEKKGS